MALSAGFLEELRARTPMPALVGRRVKLRRAGRDWTGCCPFHNEKSPSFHVYDDHFHCYGCGVHGDAISFWMQTTGASFPEAVESLAAEAGLEVPKASPAEARAEQRRLDLHEVLGRAQERFVRLLRAPEGAAALAYLRGRGLSEETIARFGLGWSGDGRGGLIAELREAGVDAERALEAGLLREAEDGTRRELYWGRVTFPIRDRRGRLISFGGRALGDAKPKYINGPDTAVFHKGRTLYGLDLAREGVRPSPEKRAPPLVVVEGYMDVIALQQAGFGAAVAPLGTALTEEHLAELWRLAEVPVLCFDGDAAGARAAERSIMLALPLLRPGLSLAIATVPGGEDPDSLVKREGRRGFEAVLGGARPLFEALYAVLSQGAGKAPEQQAALRARLDAAAGSIGDKTLAAEFRTALRNKFFDARRRKGPAAVVRGVRREFGEAAVSLERLRLLTAIILRHPELLHDVEEAYAGLPLTGAGSGAEVGASELAQLREHILRSDNAALLDSESLLAHLKQSGSADAAARVLSSAMPPAHTLRPEAMPAEAEAEWWHYFGLMHHARLEEEIASAGQAFAATPDAVSQQRLIALCAALAALPDPDDDTGA